MNSIFYFYPLIITLGILVTYTDVKSGKIKNKHLLFFSIIGLSIYLYLLITHKLKFHIYLLLNPLLGICIGFLLYTCKVWGGGDGKLFAVFCLLTPSTKYAFISPFSSLILFINIFLLAVCVMLFQTLYNFLKESNKNINLKWFSYKNLISLGKSFIIILALTWIVPYTFDYFGIHSKITNEFVFIFILYISYVSIYKLIEKIKNKYLIFSLLVVGILTRYVCHPFDFKNPHTIAMMFKKTLVYTFIFYFLRNLFELNTYIEQKKETFLFAPLMFAGVLLVNSDFILWFIQLFQILQKIINSL